MASLPKNVRGACLSGGPFYEMDIKNSFFSILYADLLSIWGPKDVGDAFPCLRSYVFHRGDWLKSISDYYQ